MIELPKLPHSLHTSKISKLAAKPAAHYQPSVFLRKPSGLMRYRHGGYNAVFPLANTSASSIDLSQFDGEMGRAIKDKALPPQPMGQILTFPKK